MFLQKTFQCSRSQIFFKLGVIVNFPIITRNICFGVSVLIKVQGWWPATLLKKRPEHRCFPVNTLKCKKKLFVEHFRWLLREWFWRISKGGLTRNNLYDLTNLTYKLRNLGNFLHWNVDDTILKRSGEFYLFRFVWRD